MASKATNNRTHQVRHEEVLNSLSQLRTAVNGQSKTLLGMWGVSMLFAGGVIIAPYLLAVIVYIIPYFIAALKNAYGAVVPHL